MIDKKKQQQTEVKSKNSKNINNDMSIQRNLISFLNMQVDESKNTIRTEELKSQEEILKIRNRSERDIEKTIKFSLEKIIIEFLPIIDSIECALNLLKKNESQEKYDQVIKKLKFSYDILKNIFRYFNVRKINSINVLFNPDIHQAMSIHYSDSIESNQVIQIMQTGYILHESRLLRPAMVMVSKKKI